MTGDITILGVDFSGAKADKNTWVTQGVLSGGALTIGSCDSTPRADRKSTRLNSSHVVISYAVFCLKKKKTPTHPPPPTPTPHTD